MALDVPRDRGGSFEPRLVPKGARRAGGLDDMIISLYAGGMTVRDIAHHLARTLGTELSHDTISKITDSVLEEVKAWQARPLEEIYPIIYLDALVVKVRDGHQVRNRAAHIAVGVDLDGVKHVLGIWVQASEGAKFWAGVCAELRNRGVRDVLIVCCDGLTGFPEAIEATWPRATVQTCTVHLIRAAMRFVSYADRKKVAAALRPIYTAPTVEAAETELLAFADSDLGRRYPAAVATWENAWERFIPFLAFPPSSARSSTPRTPSRSLNFQLRKIIKNRGHFPNDDAVIKLLWLAIRDIEDKRARATSQGERPTRQRPQSPRPPRRRRRRPGLETSPRRPRPGLPRPHRALPHLTTHRSTYTEILTGPPPPAPAPVRPGSGACRPRTSGRTEPTAYPRNRHPRERRPRDRHARERQPRGRHARECRSRRHRARRVATGRGPGPRTVRSCARRQGSP